MSALRLPALLLGVLLAGAWVPIVAVAGALPKLVVVVVIDGLPQDQILKYRDQYGPGGFKLLLDEGAWFASAHHGHAVTVTAPGHAEVLTGAYPYQSGIVENDWIDRSTLARVYCTEDPAHTYLGEPTNRHDGTSPANLRVSTLGDELRYANGGKSKVLSISGKDRGAILLAGKTGTAYMYLESSGRFVSSTYYLRSYPSWHARYYADRPQDRWFGKTWTPLLPESAYARSIPDGQPWFGNYRNFGSRFPFRLGRGGTSPDTAYYATLVLSPFGDEYALDFARAAIEGEALGRNPAGVTDLLALSLSSHDYVNHSFGPESRQSHDHLLRLDRALAAFFSYLRESVGMDAVLIALTADHGFMNAPEYSARLGFASGRIDSRKLLADLNRHLSARFGGGPYALRFSRPTILLDYERIARRSLARAEVESEAARYLQGTEGVAAVFTRSQLSAGLGSGRLQTLVQRAWDSERSGDLFIVLKPYFAFGRIPATHGSPYAYDTNVPLMLYGGRWIRAGTHTRHAEVVDLAPTLAFLLGTRLPSGSEGRVLGEALKKAVPSPSR